MIVIVSDPVRRIVAQTVDAFLLRIGLPEPRDAEMEFHAQVLVEDLCDITYRLAPKLALYRGATSREARVARGMETVRRMLDQGASVSHAVRVSGLSRNTVDKCLKAGRGS